MKSTEIEFLEEFIMSPLVISLDVLQGEKINFLSLVVHNYYTILTITILRQKLIKFTHLILGVQISSVCFPKDGSSCCEWFIVTTDFDVSERLNI